MSQRGFTLIEMSFVVVIIGLIVSSGLLALGPMYDKTHVNQTNTNLDQVENALVLFAIRNNRLPCPANGSIKPGGAKYGLEQPVGGGTCSVTPVANDIIPWQTLGIPEGYSLDAWGHRIAYFPSGTVGTSANITTGGNLIRNGTVYPTGTYLTVSDATSGAVVTPISGSDQAAYVLVSHGKSGWYGWGTTTNGGVITQQPITVASPTNKACNNDPVNCVSNKPSFMSGSPIGPYPPSKANFFDDIVRWRSPAFIIQLCGSGACGNP